MVSPDRCCGQNIRKNKRAYFFVRAYLIIAHKTDTDLKAV